MAKPINLNQARKQRDRAAKKAAAEANVVKHGRPKAARDLDAAREAQAQKRLDQAKRDDT